MAGEIEKMLHQPTPMMQQYLLDNLLMGKVHHIEALELMRLLPDASVDAIITDLPYGTTACAWDEIIPFAPMWEGVKRVLKPRGVFVTTASQPFTSALVMSNPAWFHEELVWDKVASTGYLDANRKHLKRHESVLVFCDGLPTYNAQMGSGQPYKVKQRSSGFAGYRKAINMGSESVGERYPTSIIEFSAANPILKPVHSTQKSTDLYRYLVKTYTQPGDLVLDFCCGSATTAEAARAEGRRWICGEKEAEIVAVARDRLRMPFERRHVPMNTRLDDLPMFAAVGGD